MLVVFIDESTSTAFHSLLFLNLCLFLCLFKYVCFFNTFYVFHCFFYVLLSLYVCMCLGMFLCVSTEYVTHRRRTWLRRKTNTRCMKRNTTYYDLHSGSRGGGPWHPSRWPWVLCSWRAIDEYFRLCERDLTHVTTRGCMGGRTS